MRRGFTIHHNGPAAQCVGQKHDRCERFWRAVRSYHINFKDWSDIAYSFGVCPHGTRFVGRGWDRAQWANGSDQVGPNDGRDSEWFTVLVFLGADEEPTDEMVEGTKALIAEGRASGHCGNRVLPHNAFKVKACPGPEFTAYAHAWDNQPLTPAINIGDIDMATLDDRTLQGLVIITWLAALQRRPPLNRIAEGVEAIKRDGLAAYAASITHSAEGLAVIPLKDGD